MVTSAQQGERLVGSLSAIKARAPVLGGNFGIWGGLFSSFDCAVKGYRQKEDPWNAIIAGFCTGGSLAIRGELFCPHTPCPALKTIGTDDAGKCCPRRTLDIDRAQEVACCGASSTRKYRRANNSGTSISIRFSGRMWYSLGCFRRSVLQPSENGPVG